MKKVFRIKEKHEVEVWSYVECYTPEEALALFSDGLGDPDFYEILDAEYQSEDYSTIEEVV